jgi:hypothetical protein
VADKLTVPVPIRDPLVPVGAVGVTTIEPFTANDRCTAFVDVILIDPEGEPVAVDDNLTYIVVLLKVLPLLCKMSEEL